ncbi:hypothetical protein OYT1_ch2219 [Ferriphaselus amnicola]|uniref:Motility protein n=1 Tax=Ferriphaselus amnicola TaxID=1188319 RepID=A0A2Z6GEJ1_9PROT|nr:YjfB family protein [Ferriphaselus amnicola]BBE51739.1 hypothetical protein OYT1_ch2219 [Ferriphaselus amnicola]
MNITSSTNAALISNASDTVGISILKKAMSIEAQSAMALIHALPQPLQPSTGNLPPNLGQNINTTA